MKIYRDEELINWTMDQAQSEVSFKLRHLMISHMKGEFTQFDAAISTIGKDFETASINLNIKSKSIDTGDSKLDFHFNSPDLLCTEKYRQITFTSTSISRTDSSETMELWGDLTIVGITRNIKLEMQMGALSADPFGNETASFGITGKITREDWGLRWTKAMEAGGFLVGDEVIISCKLELSNVTQHDAEQEADLVPMRVMTF